MTGIAQGFGHIVLGSAVALVIVTLAIVPFLSPAWVAFEQDRAQAVAWTGFSEPDLRAATNAILADLVLGPPEFDVTVAGTAVLNDRERGHMRDVRTVFAGLGIAALISVATLALAVTRSRRDDPASHTTRFDLWRSVRGGATWLAIGTIGLGVVALVAFDTLFAVFHTLLFPSGSYTFDPGTDRLVQLFPFQFWQETAVVVGAVIVVLAVLTARIAGRRMRAAASGREAVSAPAWGSAR